MAFITLNKKNFFNNLDIIRNKIKSIDKIAIVLKDNAYGHGLLEMATLAKEYGIKKAVVRSHKEALHVESYFEYILVLADIPKTSSKTIRYTINDINTINKFPKDTLVELKVDSGMHRNGIAKEELEEAFSKIKNTGLILEAVYTHHRSADELTSEWFWQNDNFKIIKEESIKLAKKFGFKELRFHSANSASLFRTKDFDEDMTRVGIAAYGCMQLPNALHVEGFKSVLSLYASKISSRKVHKGLHVGYSGTYTFKDDCVVSNYDFGYADGFLRTCSNNYETPDKQKLVGRISMDNSSFISNDDELLIFNNASVIAKFANTIGYEILTSLKSNLDRKYV